MGTTRKLSLKCFPTVICNVTYDEEKGGYGINLVKELS